MLDVMGLRLEEALDRLRQSGIQDIKILYTIPPFKNLSYDHNEKRVLLQKKQGNSFILIVSYV